MANGNINVSVDIEIVDQQEMEILLETVQKGTKGDPGETGATPDLTIGTVTTLPTGSPATASITGTDEDPVLNLGLPKGDPGDATIDDTAGEGDIDKVWSADKVDSEISGLKSAIGTKADVVNVTIDTPASVMSFSDGADGLPIGVKVGIEPVQDLHGMPYPYPAGAGKNLIDFSANDPSNGYVSGKYLTSDGNEGTPTGSVSWYISEYIEVEPNTQYTLSGYYNANAVYACEYDNSKNFVTSHNQNNTTATFTTDSTTKYIRISNGVSNTEVQLELGSEATSYAPYSNICPISGWTGAEISVANGNDPTAQGYDVDEYEITFPAGAGTVYGGTLTVNKDGTGKLIINKAVYAPTDSSDFSNGSGNVYIGKDTFKSLGFAYKDINGEVSTHFKRVNTTAGVTEPCFAVSSSNQLAVRAQGIADNKTVFDNYLAAQINAGTPVKFVLNLKNALEIDISASEVGAILTTLKGINNIFADTGDILSVDYSADTKLYIDQYNAEQDNTATATQSMIASSDAVVATANHAQGDVFICNNQLVRATDVITAGETVDTGSGGNAEVLNIIDFVNEHDTDLQTKINNNYSMLFNWLSPMMVLDESNIGTDQEAHGTGRDITRKKNHFTIRYSSASSTYKAYSFLGTTIGVSALDASQYLSLPKVANAHLFFVLKYSTKTTDNSNQYPNSYNLSTWDGDAEHQATVATYEPDVTSTKVQTTKGILICDINKDLPEAITNGNIKLSIYSRQSKVEGDFDVNIIALPELPTT